MNKDAFFVMDNIYIEKEDNSFVVCEKLPDCTIKIAKFYSPTPLFLFLLHYLDYKN